ncbi:MAG: OmpA family protein [Alphaproteobacteria bacterium]|nr:OmpA family protein [Alphaproteobacteria bacterium]
MFLREGSQQRNIAFALSAALSLAATTQVVAADDTTKQGGGTTAVELPREVLPWRRRAEESAEQTLAAARQSMRFGNKLVAESHLRELIRRYPGTHAAGDARQQLWRLTGERLAGKLGRSALGVHPAEDRLGLDDTTISPIAGWQTTVKRDTADLREQLIEAAGDRVFFSQGSTRLSERARQILKKQAQWLKERRQVEVRVVGHSDDLGSPEDNMRLSHDRAVAVRKGLIANGVSPRRLHVFSLGKAQPIAICTVETCAAQNRRVVTEIRYSKRAEATSR